MIKKSFILSVVRLILLTGLLSLFFACGNSTSGVSKPPSLQEFKEKEGNSKTSDATNKYWAIPEPYKGVPIEQIKSQIEITDYMVMKGAATNAGTEDMDANRDRQTSGTHKSIAAGGAAVAKETPKNKADREALAQYSNKLISLEGVVNTTATQKTAPLDIKEQVAGKYEIWFCADKNQQRKPCRYRAFLLYEGPEGKGDTLFTHDNVIRFWGVVLEEQIGILKLPNGLTFKRYPKVRVLDLEVIK